MGRCHARLLVEGVLHELLLQPEVLRLLLTFALTLQVHYSVHLSQLLHLFALFLLHLDIFEDDLARQDFVLVASGLLGQEIIPVVLGPLEALVSRLKPLLVLRAVIVHVRIGPLSQLFRLGLLRVVLVKDFLAVFLQPHLHNLLKLRVVLLLHIKLVLAFDFDLIDCARMLVKLALEVLFHRLQVSLGLFDLDIE